MKFLVIMLAVMLSVVACQSGSSDHGAGAGPSGGGQSPGTETDAGSSTSPASGASAP